MIKFDDKDVRLCRSMHSGERLAAILSAFAAHFRAKLAMLMIVASTFLGAELACADAGL